MEFNDSNLKLRLASDEVDLRAAERLRYRVFVEELGGDGPMVDHAGRFERDDFDPHFDHLVLIDQTRDAGQLDHVVGVYRLLTGEKAMETGGFYSETEYDLDLLKSSGRRLLELGRSCVDVDYRGGTSLLRLWEGLAAYAIQRDIDLLFGVASLHGTEIAPLGQPLSHLFHAHLAPPELRVRALEHVHQPMDLIPAAEIDRVAAMRQVPSLIKSYLRVGGFVGDGAFIDHAFNTTDVFLILDVAKIDPKVRARYENGARL